MKNEKAFNQLKSIVNDNNLAAKSEVKHGWGCMSLKDTPYVKFSIDDIDKVKKAFHPFMGKFNMWFRTSKKYITVYMEDLDLDRFAQMTIANGKSLKPC